MKQYKVRGQSEAQGDSRLPIDAGTLEVRQSVRIDPSLRADGPTAELAIEESDLLEVELDNGFVLWTTVDRLVQDAEAGGTRAADGDMLPTSYPLQRSGGERGFVSNAITGLKVLGYDLPKGGALAVAAKVEQQLKGDGEFFHVSPEGVLIREDPSPADGPTLVLIHGTASATANAYAGFFDENRETWRQLHDHYEGRVFGFEHRTLTASPLDNAIEFLQVLPPGADLHLVTHSRGGLVGDLIAHGGVTGDVFVAEDLERELRRAFKKKKDLLKKQTETYQAFNRLIAEKAPRVSRYARVGCPAAGTTLASGRLDVCMSILVHLMGQVPGIGPFLAGFGELVAAVAKERTKPEVLPGLEAQMPKSAFVRLLNGSDHVLDSDLTVLAGDSEGLLKNLANLFYWRANDLVVDTRSMYGGAPRARRMWYLEENRQVTHVNYFRRTETAKVVQRALTRPDGETNGFESRLPKGVARGEVDTGEATDGTTWPGVILLPGIMGSHLSVVDDADGRERIWLDIRDLMRGRGRRLEMHKFKVAPDGVMKRPYDDFRDDLAKRGVHVMPLAYDWRLSLAAAADELKALVESRLAAAATPLHIVAHSMGGLVASLFIARHGGTWKKLRERGGRLVQAGTPNRGSFVIPRILQGKEKMLRLLAGLDLASGKKKWARWVSRFPGLLELLPTFAEIDLFELQTWKDLDVLATPTRTDLDDARKIATELAEQSDRLAAEGVLYVAGGPTDTPIYDPTTRSIRWTQQGDGRVTWDSGIPSGAPTWYVPVKHGSILDCKRAFTGLRELLLTGDTAQLSRERPAVSSALRTAAEETPDLAPAEQVEIVPSLDDLEEAALGMESWDQPQEPAGPPVPPCTVSMVHGDLRFSQHPVLVGHYRGDPIVNAEGVLDRCLDRALSSRMQLGLYPGPIGSAEALLRRAAAEQQHAGPPGAVVVGLGNVGELTVGGLIRSLTAGLLRYAQARRDRGEDTSALKVSALLVGSSEAGLTIAQTVEAFLIAVDQTNWALEKLRAGDAADEGDDASGEPLAYFARLELIELYEDVALEALHELRALGQRTVGFDINRSLLRRAGGLRRARAKSPAGWWNRLSIRSRPDGSPAYARHAAQPTVDGARADGPGRHMQILRFTAYGERARVAVTELVTQRLLVDQLLTEAQQDPSAEQIELPQTLFELLVPAGLKGIAGDRRNLQLVLDEGTAAYPWEMLIDRSSGTEEPMGVTAGMLRQLRVDDVEVVGHPEENRVLVVGDPPSSLAPLPGAVREANKVATIFADRGWDVIQEIREESGDPGISASSVVQAVMTNDVRILHLAGHGVYDPLRPLESGMVLAGGPREDQPDLIVLSAAEVKQMRLKPELVFINCCHLGRIEETQPFHRLAANLATEFIRSGVKAVVAAGWPVDDGAAESFCETFYSAMLAGADFGEAVKQARQLTYERYDRTNTWAAYQCYGDPGFRLTMDRGVRARVTGRHRDDDEFLDSSELVIELDNVRSRAKVPREGSKETLAQRAEQLQLLAQRKDWLEHEGVLVGLARAYGELGNFETAVELYERAGRLEKGGMTLTDAEQCANFRSRLGQRQDSVEAVRSSNADLKQLIEQHGETAERRSLLAGSYKRLVQMEEELEPLRANLREMTRQYALAAECRTVNWYYPATNALLGVLLLGGPWTRAPKKGTVDAAAYGAVSWARAATFDDRMQKVEAALRGRTFENFWDAAAVPDLAVVQAIAAGRLRERADELAGRYRGVMQVYGSGREIDSVINQWTFARTTAAKLRLRTAGRPGAKREVTDALDAFVQALEG